MTPLTAEETQRFNQLEEAIDAKLAGFFEVRSALMEIKTKGLSREIHRSFDRYCRERWGPFWHQ